MPHRTEDEKVLLELVPKTARKIFDMGTLDGRLVSLLKIDRPEVESVAVDFSATMLEAVKKRFAGDAKTLMKAHNLDDPLPNIVKGHFDVVVSSIAIHYLTHARKLSLCALIFDLLP